jgi:hypothetical protein
MITKDGYLVAENSNFMKRCGTMYLVFRCLLDPSLTSALKPNWFKFISVATQYIVVGRYRCLEGKDLDDWNNASV